LHGDGLSQQDAAARNGPIVIGLTGGIASGKSSVSQHLLGKRAHLIEADRVGHEVIAPDGEAYAEVVAAFGREIVAADGTIDRRRLGAIVFGGKDKLAMLNRISHPHMATRMAQEVARVRALSPAKRPPAIVLEAAILFEAKWEPLCDTVWAVEAPVELSISRLMARNGLSLEEAQARLNAQITNEERATRAGKVIRNTGSMEFLLGQVDLLWREVTDQGGAGA
jgi:dephospho-CoA kinase